MQWGHAVATHHTPPPLGAAPRPASLRYISHQQHHTHASSRQGDAAAGYDGRGSGDGGRGWGALGPTAVSSAAAAREPAPLLPQWAPHARRRGRVAAWAERARRNAVQTWTRFGAGTRAVLLLLLALLIMVAVGGLAAALASTGSTAHAQPGTRGALSRPSRAPLAVPQRASPPPPPPTGSPPEDPDAPLYDNWLQYAADPGAPDAAGWRTWVHPRRQYRIPGLDAGSITRLRMCCRPTGGTADVCCGPDEDSDAAAAAAAAAPDDALICIVRHGQLHVFAPPDAPLPPDTAGVACTVRWT